jgi:osmotically-inducible protein OsmY
LTTDVRGVIERSVVLSNPRGIDVAVAEGGTVVLRGNVRDQDEARLAEGMIRLTPGVREVQNQLTYPRNNP